MVIMIDNLPWMKMKMLLLADMKTIVSIIYEMKITMIMFN